MFKYFILTTLFLSGVTNAETDPTQPFGRGATGSAPVEKINQMKLQSIIHGNSVHTVIINGKLLKVGDYIGDFKLVAVNDKSVVLRSEDERKKLHMFSELTAK